MMWHSRQEAQIFHNEPRHPRYQLPGLSPRSQSPGPSVYSQSPAYVQCSHDRGALLTRDNVFYVATFSCCFLKIKICCLFVLLDHLLIPSLSDTVWLSEIACFTFHRSQTFGGGSFHIFIILTKTACRKLLMVPWNVRKILSETEICMQIFRNSRISRIYINSQRYDMEAFEWIEQVTPRNVVNCKALGRQL